ncbi:hypothetical protein DFH07DRAFT_706241, partial [Mycena maculata]
GYLDGAHLLLENGADINDTNDHHGTALQVASSMGHTEIVRFLLHKGACVNTAGGFYGDAVKAAS